jgi:hypothetical protein
MEKNQNKFQTSNVIFEMTINCFFSLKSASTVSRQIVVQILGLESPKVCGNLALRPLLGGHTQMQWLSKLAIYGFPA